VGVWTVTTLGVGTVPAGGVGTVPSAEVVTLPNGGWVLYHRVSGEYTHCGVGNLHTGEMGTVSIGGEETVPTGGGSYAPELGTVSTGVWGLYPTFRSTIYDLFCVSLIPEGCSVLIMPLTPMGRTQEPVWSLGHGQKKVQDFHDPRNQV
jgi:hypothetical protein